MKHTIRVGGAIGYWGESPVATPQFLEAGAVDYIIYDYLAEITLSIMARARQSDAELGYATDFVSDVVQPYLHEVARQGVRLITNAGGVNPQACARKVRSVAEQYGLDLSVAVVEGDDLYDRREEFSGSRYKEMFTGLPLPAAADNASINAYLGAFPIARALAEGADVVITGRCVDSALTLGACIHEFGWQPDAYDRLAAGSLAGHLLECGPQATGGNYTDWATLAEPLDTIGYPVGEIAADGSLVMTKPAGTGGSVTVGSVAEQLLYEIGDPQAYMLPDVVCDFSRVVIRQQGEDRVSVAGATGTPPPLHYKVSVTAQDGFRGGALLTFYGLDAPAKARAYADAAFRRARAALSGAGSADFTETSVEILGAQSQYGDASHDASAREVVLKIAARHDLAQGIVALLKALAGLGLAAPPGLSGFAGARPRPAPVLRLHSFLLEKSCVKITVEVGGRRIDFADVRGQAFDAAAIERPPRPPVVNGRELVEVPLVQLAWGRSGDKGNSANIGIIARDAAYLPYIWAALSRQRVADRFAHFLGSADASKVQRFLLPGCAGINFLLQDVLGGGGVASLRNDPQGKGYAQILLEAPVAVPRRLL